MSEESKDTQVRLIAQGPDLWRVRVLFESGLEEFIPEKLRDIKSDLAEGFGVPDTLLEYVQLLSKRHTEKGILVEMQIRKQPIPSGKLLTRYLPSKAEDGTEFSNMIIEADFFPIDTYGKPITRRTIESYLSAEGIDLTLVDWKLVNAVIKEVTETMQMKSGVVIGQGRLPSSSQDSILNCPVPPDQQHLKQNAWMGLRAVTTGETLVEVTMGIGGSKAGKNVFGREIDPRKPIQTRLEAGNGCAISAVGNRLIAKKSGILVLERQYRDRRAKDSAATLPTKIIASIHEPEVHEGGVEGQLVVHKPSIIRGTLKSGSLVHADSHLIIEGNVEPNTQIDCLGSLRIVGNIRDANISAKEHLSITGKVFDSFISGDLTVQIDGSADNCTIYAREIIASELTGGVAEALSQTLLKPNEETKGLIQFNYRKFLETQQKEGVVAINELREQMSIVNDLFGHDIIHQINEDNIQLMLLRWLRDQKTHNTMGYSFREVQNYREILSVIPFIRSQLSAVGEELRDVTAQLDVPDDGVSESND